MSKEKVMQFLVLFIAFGALLAVVQFGYFSNVDRSITGFAIFNDNLEADFDLGTYANVEYNGSALVLSGNNLTGNYTSQIFDATQISDWNNISLNKIISDLEVFLSVDTQADFWKSTDSGVTWNLLKDDYNGASGNNADYLVSNSSGSLFILDIQDVWKSDDFGATWSKINDDFNPSDTNGGKVIAVNSTDAIFIIDGSEDVWVSIDSAVSFSKVNDDFNSGTSSSAFGLTVNSTDNLFLVDGLADVYQSIDSGTTWTKINDDYNGAAGNSADDMDVDSSDNLFILHGQDIWKSTDSGVTWTKINDDFNPSDGNNGVLMYIYDSDIFIVDASEDIWKSTDSGVTFSPIVSDFNGGNGNIFGLRSVHSYSNISYQVRACSSSDCSDASFIGTDGTTNTYYSNDTSFLSVQGRYFQYRVFFEMDSNNTFPYLEEVDLDYDFSASAPLVDIILPQEDSTFGFDRSIELNFTVVNITSALDSCWYTTDDGVTNTTLTGCGNSTFDVSGDGDYTVWLYVNESVSGLIGSDNANFSVTLGAPSITLTSPIDSYLSSGQDVEFIYTATDIDLASCSLWGDFDGTFKLNQTDSSVVSGLQSSFSLNLSDGTYKWNVECTDDLSNSAMNGNKTFYVDTLNPGVELSAPFGTYTSLTEIPISLSVSDASPVTCTYNITSVNTGIVVIGDTIISDCSSGTFGVDSEVDHTFYLKTNDSAGNIVYNTSNFSVSTPVPTSEGSGSGGSGGGVVIARVARIGFSSLSDLEMGRGEGNLISWSVENTGNVFLNNCKLSLEGIAEEWISNKQLEDLSPGQIVEYFLDVNVPLNAEIGNYDLSIGVVCDETDAIGSFVVDVSVGDFEILILSSEKIPGNRLRVFYSVESFKDKGEEITISYSLLDSTGNDVYIGEELVTVFNGREEFVLEFNLPKDSIGEYTLRMLADNGFEVQRVEQPVFLSESGLAGFALFGENGRTIAVSGIIFVVLVGGYFIFRSVRKNHRKIKVREGRHRHFIKIDLKK